MHLRMGIIKVEIKIPELVKVLENFKENRLTALETFSGEIQSSMSEFFQFAAQDED